MPRVYFAVAAAAFLLGSAVSSFGETLETIKKRGSVIIGVKSDYKPWGFTDEKGHLTGMEVELARDIAKRLKVKLQLVPVLSSNRVQFLNEGKVDLILATFSVTEERKTQVAFIEPSYYAAMTAILTKTDAAKAGEGTFKGARICAVAGNYANKAVSGLVGGDLIEAKTLPEAEEKLRSGDCDGVGFDDVVLLYQIKSEAAKWKDYDISLLLAVPPAPWSLALPLAEKDGKLAQFLSGVVKAWHRKGKLLALEKKWVGDNSMALKWLTNKVQTANAAGKGSKTKAVSKNEAVKPKPVSTQAN